MAAEEARLVHSPAMPRSTTRLANSLGFCIRKGITIIPDTSNGRRMLVFLKGSRGGCRLRRLPRSLFSTSNLKCNSNASRRLCKLLLHTRRGNARHPSPGKCVNINVRLKIRQRHLSACRELTASIAASAVMRKSTSDSNKDRLRSPAHQRLPPSLNRCRIKS